MKEKSQPKKYERREFLKQTGRIGFGAAAYGTAGGLVGKGYKTGRDAYAEKVKPYVDKGKEIIDKTEDTKEGIDNWWNKYIRRKEGYEKKDLEKQETLEEAKQISRRSLFKKYFNIFNKNPVETGIVTGAGLGALVKTLTLYPRYLDKKKIAKLKDEHIEYKEKMDILEEYNERLEKASKDRDQKIKGLEEEVEKLKKIYETLNESERGRSGLEEKAQSENELKTTLSALLSGIGLIIGFVLINGVDYTGLVTISKESMSTTNFLGIIVIFTSFSLILIGAWRIRKLSKSKNYR